MMIGTTGSVAEHYSPNLVEEEFSEVCIQDRA
jgi:hypothetical protein